MAGREFIDPKRPDMFPSIPVVNRQHRMAQAFRLAMIDTELRVAIC
jgi:hypothetical protein